MEGLIVLQQSGRQWIRLSHDSDQWRVLSKDSDQWRVLSQDSDQWRVLFQDTDQWRVFPQDGGYSLLLLVTVAVIYSLSLVVTVAFGFYHSSLLSILVPCCCSWLLATAFGYCSFWLISVFYGYCRSWLLRIALDSLECLMRQYSRAFTPSPYLSVRISIADMFRLFSVDLLLDVGSVVQSWCTSSYFHILTLWHPSIHPYVALQPLPGLGLPHKTPQFIPIFSSSPPSSYPQQL